LQGKAAAAIALGAVRRKRVPTKKVAEAYELAHLTLVVGLRANDLDSELLSDASDHLFDLGEGGRTVPAAAPSSDRSASFAVDGRRATHCFASRLPNKAWFTPLKSKNCAEQRREVFSVFSNRRKQDRCAYSLRVVWLVEGFGRIDLGDASDAGGSLRAIEGARGTVS
jgi:hypothetical protein